MATETYLRVPGLFDLDPERLEMRLSKAADRAGLLYDGPESSEEWEIHAFGDITPEGLIEIVKPVLRRGQLTVTGEREVTWQPPKPPPWIVQNFWESTPYERALKRRIKALGEDPKVAAWWGSTGKRQIIFFMHKQPGADTTETFGGTSDDFVSVAVYTDISLLNDDHPSRERLDSESKRFLRLVLDGVAKHVNSPRPKTPLLDE